MHLETENAQFRDLYMTHRDAVWSYIVRRVGRNDVDDAVAEVFVVAWRKTSQAPDIDEQLPWLYGIAKNVLRNVNRSSSRRNRLWIKATAQPSTDSPPSDVQVIRNSEDEELLAAVAKLRAIDQEVLRLRTWEELAIKDIAIVVGMSPKSVESRLVRIRKNLARSLAVPLSPAQSVRPGLAKQGGEQ
ncbi:MAG: sigma-70 family RNA polymerase sigma factor [Acidimicrobiia bacterium]|nr:MAG: sigma-70 family RNA polymerase sigma factor [Acidimicrobiia bacterium]